MYNKDPDTQACQNMDEIGPKHHIHHSTHQSGYTLDRTLTHPDDAPSSVTVKDILLSDWFAIAFSIYTQKPSLQIKELAYRKTKSIDNYR